MLRLIRDLLILPIQPLELLLCPKKAVLARVSHRQARLIRSCCCNKVGDGDSKSGLQIGPLPKRVGVPIVGLDHQRHGIGYGRRYFHNEIGGKETHQTRLLVPSPIQHTPVGFYRANPFLDFPGFITELKDEIFDAVAVCHLHELGQKPGLVSHTGNDVRIVPKCVRACSWPVGFANLHWFSRKSVGENPPLLDCPRGCVADRDLRPIRIDVCLNEITCRHQRRVVQKIGGNITSAYGNVSVRGCPDIVDVADQRRRTVALQNGFTAHHQSARGRIVLVAYRNEYVNLVGGILKIGVADVSAGIALDIVSIAERGDV